MTQTGTLDADVIVVGLGSMGSMAAWRLAKRPGVRVIGIEQFGLGHPHGGFSGESRLFRTAYHEGSGYVPMLLRARELWLELGEAADRSLLLPIGALSIGKADQASLMTVLDSVADHSLPHEVLSGREIAVRWPQHAVDDDHMGVLDLLGGAVRPEAAVLSAIELAERHGASISTGEQVICIDPQGDGTVVVRTDSRTLRATSVVVSAGAWSERLNPELKARTEIYPLLLTWFLPRLESSFDPQNFPAFIRDEPGVHFFGAPSVDGYTVKVSPARMLPPVETMDQMPTSVDPVVLSAVGRAAQRFFPGLYPEPVRYSVHPDAFTTDKVPVIDRSSDGTVVTLAGFSGHGFKFAPIIGEMAADLALTGASDLFDPSFALDAHRAIPSNPSRAREDA